MVHIVSDLPLSWVDICIAMGGVFEISVRSAWRVILGIAYRYLIRLFNHAAMSRFSGPNNGCAAMVCLSSIDLLHKYHNASVPYPTIHHFVTEMCTCVHISVTKWCIVGNFSNELWDLWDASIAKGNDFHVSTSPDYSYKNLHRNPFHENVLWFTTFNV